MKLLRVNLTVLITLRQTGEVSATTQKWMVHISKYHITSISSLMSIQSNQSAFWNEKKKVKINYIMKI